MGDPAADPNVDPQTGRGRGLCGPLWTSPMDHQSPDDYLTVMLGNSMRTRPRGWLPSTLLPNFWKRRLQRTGQQTEPLGKAASGPSRASVNPGHSPRVT